MACQAAVLPWTVPASPRRWFCPGPKRRLCCKRSRISASSLDSETLPLSRLSTANGADATMTSSDSAWSTTSRRRSKAGLCGVCCSRSPVVAQAAPHGVEAVALLAATSSRACSSVSTSTKYSGNTLLRAGRRCCCGLPPGLVERPLCPAAGRVAGQKKTSSAAAGSLASSAAAGPLPQKKASSAICSSLRSPWRCGERRSAVGVSAKTGTGEGTASSHGGAAASGHRRDLGDMSKAGTAVPPPKCTSPPTKEAQAGAVAAEGALASAATLGDPTLDTTGVAAGDAPLRPPSQPAALSPPASIPKPLRADNGLRSGAAAGTLSGGPRPMLTTLTPTPVKARAPPTVAPGGRSNLPLPQPPPTTPATVTGDCARGLPQKTRGVEVAAGTACGGASEGERLRCC